MSTSTVASSDRDRGPGLFDRLYDDGSNVVTNVRIAGKSRAAGSGLINFATGLLFTLAVGLFAVSVNAQVTYVYAEKHQHLVSFIEAISLDAAMSIFSLLALGLARSGKSAKIERALVLVCALASAGMNYAAANVLSPRSIVAFIAPPLLLAVVVDRVVAVVRRHVLGEDDTSPWRPFGRAALYLVRFVVSPISTVRGARRALLQATPVPAPALKLKALPWPPPAAQAEVLPAAPKVPAIAAPSPTKQQPKRKAVTKPKTTTTKAGSKQADLIRLAIEEHGLADKPIGEVSKLATRLAGDVDLHPATARRVLVAHARALQNGDGK